jgi:ubiquinone/menaquinone biosynthesis C-methylase UbiE
MAGWGFEAIAVDANISSADGLQAGQKFINEGSRFLRVRARMERLPFAPGRIRLLASNASFHYARDFRVALSEFERVLTPGGMIAIIDTPFYENAADGERMMAERVAEFRHKYGMEEALARSSRYMTFSQLEELAGSLNLRRHVYPVWPGMQRKYEGIRAIFLSRRIAQFPVVVLEKA